MHVLIVDDNRLVRTQLADVVAAMGHEVRVVGDGEGALQALAQQPAELVLLDWMLPGKNGLETCRRLRELPGGDACYVLMITAKDSLADARAALDAGADDYLFKPVERAHLEIRVAIAEKKTQIRRAELSISQE